MTENAALQSHVQEVTGLQQQLTRMEGELSRAEETIRREQQQRQQVGLMCVTCSVCCDKQTVQEIEGKDRELTQARQQVQMCLCVFMCN